MKRYLPPGGEFALDAAGGGYMRVTEPTSAACVRPFPGGGAVRPATARRPYPLNDVPPAARASRPARILSTILLALLALFAMPFAATVNAAPVLSDRHVHVLEGGRSPVSVTLSSRPSGTVTVNIARAVNANTGRIIGGTAITPSPTTLTFTPSKWNTAQTVTLTGPALRNGYQYRPDNYFDFTVAGTTGSVRLRADVVDPHWRFRRPGVVTSGTTPGGRLIVPDYGHATYRLKLAAQPFADVVVSPIFKADGPFGNDTFHTARNLDGDGYNGMLTFTVQNWNEWQTVYVFAGDSDQRESQNVHDLCHVTTSTGDPGYHFLGFVGNRIQGIGCIRLIEVESAIPGIVLEPNQWEMGWRFDLAEGETKDFKVRLRTQPSANVRLTPVRHAPSALHPGDATITAHSLTFTASNWDTPQTLTFTAAEDDDDWRYTPSQRFVFMTTSSDANYSNKRFTTIDVRAIDNDGYPGAIVEDQDRQPVRDFGLSREYLLLPAGQRSTWFVRLTVQPKTTQQVTVRPSVAPHDQGEFLSTGSAVVFTRGNWYIWQEITVQPTAGSQGETGMFLLHFESADPNYQGVSREYVGYWIVAASPAGTEAPDPEVLEPVTGTSGVAGTEAPDPEVLQPVTGQTGGPDPNPGGEGDNGNPDVTDPDDELEPGVVEPVEPRDPDVVGVDVRAGGEFLKITDGQTAAYQVVLLGPPTHDVYVAVEKDFGPPLLSVSPATLVFTPDNWNQAQQVVVSSPVDSDSMSGNGLFYHTVTSDDAWYDGLTAGDVRVRSGDFDNFSGGAPFRGWLSRLPAQHQGRNFTVRLGFDKAPDNLGANRVRNHVVTVQGGLISSVQQVNNRAFTLTVRPNGNADVVMTLQPTGSCGGAADVCTRRNGSLLSLQTGYEAWIPGPLN